jgi:His-Xaa-Ser system radical SAM maturase HxsB
MNREKYDMTRESADRALDLTFRSPAKHIKIEFQGGEPLLNFELIQYITEGAKQRNATAKKSLQFVVATNLSFLSDEILAYLKKHRICVSTSLDGPAFIHNANRPRPGNDAYETTIRGMARVRQVLGGDAVSALMTTTKLSLQHPEAIVNEYVRQGFDHVFLRPLSPYGFALKTQAKTGYDLVAFLSFYKRALSHIIELNRQGRWMVEIYAQILLTKILTPFATGYVDLQSPAGAGISVAVYNYDGDVYATDEARMLAQMGDTTFRLGNVHTDSYKAIFGGELLRSLVAASCVESLPGCADCAFQTFCGADPVENYATQGDIFGHRPTSRFCGRNMEIIRHLLRLYHGDDPFVRELFWAWVHNTAPDVLLPELPA